jgi:ABC-type transport system involved in multi-copper enzyme maturation permease subunit
MLSLYRAEWLKLSRMGLTRILALVLLGIGVIIPLISVVNVVGTGPTNFRQDSFFRLSFPEAIRVGQDAINRLGVLVMVVLIATVIGSEYGQDTWKNLLVRRNTRLGFLIAKLVVSVLGFGAAFILLLGITQLLASLGYELVKESALKAGLVEQTLKAQDFYQSFYANGVEQLLYFSVAGAFATLFTIVGRSTVAGILLTLLWYISETVSRGGVPELLANLTIVKNLDSLKQNLLDGSGPLPSGQSLGLVGSYIVIALAVGFVIFQRRDIEG